MDFIAIPADQHAADTLTAELADVHDELRRADTKATGLLGLFGAALAGLVALTRTADIATPAVLLLHLALLPAGVAVVVLLLVLRSRISSNPTAAGFPRWATYHYDPVAVLEEFTDPAVVLARRARALVLLSGLALVKHHRIGTAVNSLLTAGALLLLALPLA
ncbi:Pycsar system effector family protein [Umezawaea beigongshangensis]|uniref:Pycsar system effector family protein n=1 Tax=Umezawaea beigongshangensis TaxID=2780383 RepID=UPI0018F1BBA8|nr:Pycsar system effector family protein [Umezawaea beigongshangensis]